MEKFAVRVRPVPCDRPTPASSKTSHDTLPVIQNEPSHTFVIQNERQRVKNLDGGRTLTHEILRFTSFRSE